MTQKMSPWVLVIDDEPNIVELLRITLRGMGLEILAAHSLAEAYASLTTGVPSLVLSDLRLPDGSGVDLVRHVHTLYPQVPIAVITAYSSADGAVEAMQAGAFDYMAKPIELARLRRLVTQATHLTQVNAEGHDGTFRLVGDSLVMQQLREDIRKVALSNAPVHIAGETGTGKELAARAIHDSGPRHDKPFVAINCGAIPEGLVESEFFGAEKGAYSGAIQHREGLFLAANGGTLFLDEIGDLPTMMQVKLLRAIQERVIRPLGADREISVDVRFISATHRDLAEMVKAGTFRQDLSYRLNVVQLNMPPLRERLEDIPQLVAAILQRISGNGTHNLRLLPEATIERLAAYHFPGNVRELENLLERSIALPEKDILEAGSYRSWPALENSSNLREKQTVIAKALGDVEADLLRSILDEVSGNHAEAAHFLGISRQSLELRLRHLLPTQGL
ncbi:MAG: sigma-54-dependent transcriptional regulator [Acidithiobacillus sp.]